MKNGLKFVYIVKKGFNPFMHMVLRMAQISFLKFVALEIKLQCHVIDGQIWHTKMNNFDRRYIHLAGTL